MAILRGLIVEITLVLFMIYLVFRSSRVVGGTSISSQEEDEDLELERQLKLLNKPPVKSIKTDYGDIYDCVDIKKQPAFDHPLLKSHTIQMKPSSLPKGMMNKESLKIKPSEIGFKSNGCPPGTVIIRRTQKEDLIRARSLVRRNPGNTHQLTKESPGYHFAAVMLQIPDTKYYGAYVNPKLFGDSRCRLFSYWTADGFHNTGCFNLLCSGFVQVSSEITFGSTFSNISTAGGPQFEQDWLVFKDPKSGNWWLVFEHNYIGYWPSNIFTTLTYFANTITAGGEVFSPTNEPSPPLGSGHLPEALNLKSTALARRLQIVNKSNQIVDPNYDDFRPFADNPKCYNVIRAIPWAQTAWKNSFLFGGPGGACGV
ncbi:uncharacterized protein LOC122658230 [Telopea speciosissima]|uniref:uncharacterized protein LOC122658230 n=1 Tax=Telopea speciosissima TaxID=54955 RepID=UPI001CC40BFE|nr:uncharacterized protein LOC122658230 [Telopea speciosissima]